MKALIVFCVLLAMNLLLQAKGDCILEGETVPVGEHIRGCAKYTCHKDGHVSGLTCPVYRCRNQVGYRQDDMSKPYPQCCGGPICKEN